MFAEFDFSMARQGAQASTFTRAVRRRAASGAAAGGGRAEPGADLHAALTLPFAAAVRGVERQVVVTRQVRAARARARARGVDAGKCAHCQGAGQIRWARGPHGVLEAVSDVRRRRATDQQRCAVLRRRRATVRSEAVTVPVPAGISDGAAAHSRDGAHRPHGGPPAIST